MKINLSLLFLLCTILLFTNCRGKRQKTNEGAEDGPMPTAPIMDEVRKNIKYIEENDFEGNLEKFGILEDSGNYQGAYTKLRPDGTMIEEAYYNNGNLDGLRILYYANQDTQIVETHVNGVFHGPYRSFYQGNRIKLSGEYSENQMQGIWYKYYETGELMEEVTFVNSLENGPFTEYHKNGQISVQGNYLDGDNEDGELKFFTEEGIHFKTMNCKKGLCRTTWRLEEETIDR